MKGIKILDLGCGDGGLAIALAERGAYCLGIDRNETRIAQALKGAAQHGVKAEFLAADVLDSSSSKQLLNQRLFDLMILSEFVEHLGNLSNVGTVLRWCQQYLLSCGCLFISFPPWFSPFAGHQAGWPAIRFMPWFHLLPDRLKRLIVPRHASPYIAFAKELNRLTIRSFEQTIIDTNLTIVRRDLFHLRPEFYWRYGVPVVRSSLLAKFPVVREVTTTGAFYLLAKQ